MNKLNSHGLWWSELMPELTPATLLVSTISMVIVYAIIVRYKQTISNTSPPLPPGPISLPIVGYLPFLKPDLHKQFTNLAQTYGPIFKYYIGSKLFVVINTTELVNEVVRQHDETFANRHQTVAALVFTYGGTDIIFSKNNANWRKQRKLFIQEVLSSKNLEACSSFRIVGVRETINHLFRKIGTEVNISEVAFLTQTNVIKRIIRENSLDEGAEDSDAAADLQNVASVISKMLGKPNVSDFFPSLARFDLQGVERTMKKQLQKMEVILKTMIDDRVKFNSKKTGERRRADSKKKDFLQILLDMKENDSTPLSDIEMNSLILTIMFAATDTTANIIVWAMAEIMKNQQVMKRIQQELTSIVGDNNIVEEFHLEKLLYLNATFKETHRLHPVGPLLIPRVPSQDCTIGGYTIPKDSIVFLNVWSIQRDARYWDNPLEFKPERFLSDEGNKKYDYRGNSMKYMPFGSGRRACAGIPLAEKMQMLTLASLLHSFNWSLPEDAEHDLTETFGLALKKTKPLIAIPSQRLNDVNLYV